MLTRITWSESPIGQRVAVRSSPAFCSDIKFVDTYRGAEYQVTRYANWRLGRLASRRYLKENKGVRWWIFWRARLLRGWVSGGLAGTDLDSADPASAGTAGADPALAATAGADPALVGTALVGTVSAGDAS